MTTTERNISDLIGHRDLGVEIDDLYNVLASPRRRYVIARLNKAAKPMAMADVADELTNWECDTPSAQIPREEVMSRYLSLYHVHAPKLADVGVVEWNEEKNTVALKDGYEEIAVHLSLSTGE